MTRAAHHEGRAADARRANAEAAAEIVRLRASGLAWADVALTLEEHENEALRRTRFGARWTPGNVAMTARRYGRG